MSKTPGEAETEQVYARTTGKFRYKEDGAVKTAFPGQTLSGRPAEIAIEIDQGQPISEAEFTGEVTGRARQKAPPRNKAKAAAPKNKAAK